MSKNERPSEFFSAAAVALRSQDPDLYWRILQTANTEQLDPDAYVAVVLSVTRAQAPTSSALETAR